MNSDRRGRRRFLKECAAVTGLAVTGVNTASGQRDGTGSLEPRPKGYPAVGDPSRFENSERWLGVWGATTPLQDTVGIITPSSLHFMAAIPNAGPFVEFSIEEDANAGEKLYSPALKVVDGKVKIPDGPGWGVKINPAWIEKANYLKSEKTA